jgi:hypothetical protein
MNSPGKNGSRSPSPSIAGLRSRTPSINGSFIQTAQDRDEDEEIRWMEQDRQLKLSASEAVHEALLQR